MKKETNNSLPLQSNLRTKSILMNNAHEILLSVIVPVYNVEQYIRSCIESIYKQGLSESSFEVIVVNDGTQDNSMGVIQDIVNEHSNIFVINQENQGISVARNNGIAQAKGEYLLMIDSDDILIPGTLGPVLAKAVETKVDLVVSEFLKMTDEQIDAFPTTHSLPSQKKFEIVPTTGIELLVNNMKRHANFVWRTLFKRSFLQENNIRFVPGILYEDIPFTNECYLKAHSCLKTTMPIYIYRKRMGSVTLSNFGEFHARSYSTAMVKTWNLSKTENLDNRAKEAIKDIVFTLLSFQIYYLSSTSLPTKRITSLLRMIKKDAPDMSFTHGMNQRLKSFMFWYMPQLYIYLRRFYAQNVEDKGHHLLHGNG